MSKTLLLLLLVVAALCDSVANASVSQFRVGTWLVGPVDVSVSTLTTSTAVVEDNGIQTATITATLLNLFGYAVAGKAMSLGSNRTGAVDSISSPSGASSVSGMVIWTVSSNIAGPALFTATDTTDGVTLIATVLVVFTSVSPTLSTVGVSGSPLVADGVAFATISVVLKDVDSNTVQGKTLTPTTGRTGDVFTPASVVTDSAGAASFHLTATLAGVATVTVTDTSDSFALSPSPTPTVTFNAGPVSASLSTFTPASSSATVNGNVVFTLTLYDQYTNPVSGHTATITSNRTGGVDAFTPSSGASISTGVVQYSVKSTLAGGAKFTVYDNTQSLGINAYGVIMWYAGTASSSLSTLVVNAPSSNIANGVVADVLVSTWLDSWSNPIPSLNVICVTNRTAADTISPAMGATNATGVVVFTATSVVPGDVKYNCTELN